MIAGWMLWSFGGGVIFGAVTMAFTASVRIKELQQLLNDALDELSESCDQQDDLLDYFGGYEHGTRHH